MCTKLSMVKADNRGLYRKTFVSPKVKASGEKSCTKLRMVKVADRGLYRSPFVSAKLNANGGKYHAQN